MVAPLPDGTPPVSVPAGPAVLEHVSGIGATGCLLGTGPPTPDEPTLSRELCTMALVLLNRIERPPDVVVAVIPDIGGAAAATRITNRWGAALIVVVTEHTEIAALPANSRPRWGTLARQLARFESYPLRQADAVVVPSPAVRSAVEGLGVPPYRITLAEGDGSAWRASLATLVDAILPPGPPTGR